MAQGLVKLFIQRLNSLLFRETETFSGLEHQTERLMTILREVGGQSSGLIWRMNGGGAASSWINELTGVIFGVDNLIAKFIIQMDQENESDRSCQTKHFTSESQAIESRLAASVQEMTQLTKSTAVGVDK
ncbi:hypothetical protein CUMW_103700 [Citrus unshiu]|nr:hypothetical protein CUMW_103700 [Citrus unshiu]